MGVETFIGVVVGGLITFVASWFFYRRASEDLRQQAGDLKRYNLLLIRLLDDAGVVSVEWDPETGEPRRIVLLRGVVSARARMEGNLQVGDPDQAEPPEEEREDR